MFWGLVAFAAVAVAALIWAEWKHSPLRFVAKPLASVAFVSAALERGAIDSTYGTILAVGLVLAALGDVFLLGSTRSTFLAGLVSFLLGHVAYVVAFAALGMAAAWTMASLVTVGVVGWFVVGWLKPHLTADMRGPVYAYIVVISLMVIAAAGATGAGATGWILVGAIAFFLSDLAVARNQFVVDSISNRMWGLPLYYAAQFVLAWTVGI